MSPTAGVVNVFDESQLDRTIRVIDERDDSKINVFNAGELEKVVQVDDVTEIKVVSAIQQGLTGAAGSQILTGDGVPSNALGIPSDQYIDLTTGRLYNKSGAGVGVWIASVLITDARYEHVNDAAALTWTVVHNLGKYPSVTVIDSGGSVIEGDINYTDANTATVTFVAATSGKAYCN